MEKIVIFRFHKHPSICLNRLELLNKLNPGIEIYGIYGGEEKDLSKFEETLRGHLKHIWVIKNKTNDWKWQNFDLALRDWYKQIGKDITFDRAYIVEWDLILTDSLDNIYAHIPKEELGLTGFNKLSLVEKEWDWVAEEPSRSDWLKLLEFVKKKYNYSLEPNASLGPGLCLPREFLEKYSEAEVPELCHDELRVPLYSQIFNLKCKDTGFYKKWFDDDEKKYFNCVNRDIDIEIIKTEIKNNGRKAFHPFRKLFHLKLS